MRTVRIYGMALNLIEAPPLSQGVEAWCSNYHKGYQLRHRYIISKGEWTRWFNLHSRQHMDVSYPAGVAWYKNQDGTRPIYTQKFQPDFPGCVEFPREAIQAFFGGCSYFRFTGAWLIAFAIMEGFERIELWGFELKDSKPRESYKFERPNFFYWVQQARDRGIEVTYQPEIEALPFIVGDPIKDAGPIYGYETKPEPDDNRNLGE